MHDSPITTLDVNPVNESICTGGYDGKVICFRQGMDPAWEFKADDLINHVSFSSEGRIVAAACADGYVYLLDADDGVLRSKLGPHQDDVNAVAWRPGGGMLAAVMDAHDARIALWNVESGVEEDSIYGHEHGVFAVSFSPDGARLATAAEDGTGRVWDIETKEEILTLPHPGDPETIDWSSDGRFIASGCDDGVLRLWDGATGELVRTFQASAAIRFVRFAKDSRRVLSGSYEGLVRIHDVEDLRTIGEHKALFQWERAAAFKGDSVVVGSFGGVPVVHREDGTPSGISLTRGINSLHTRNGRIVVGRDDGQIVDVSTGAPLYAHDSIVNSVYISEDGKILSGDYVGGLKVYDTVSGRLLAEAVSPGGPVNSAFLLPDENKLYAAGYDGILREWSTDLTETRELGAHDGPIKSIAWNAATGTVIAGSSDDSLSGWRDGVRVFHQDPEDLVLVNSVASNPSRAEFASASRDGRVRLWNADTGDLLDTLPLVHTKSVKVVAYHAGGEDLVSGSYDGTALLWSKRGGYWRARQLKLHGKPGVPAAAFDGDAVLTGGWDGRVARWNLSGELIGSYSFNTRQVA